jgi:hypothetical protein
LVPVAVLNYFRTGRKRFNCLGNRRVRYGPLYGPASFRGHKSGVRWRAGILPDGVIEQPRGEGRKVLPKNLAGPLDDTARTVNAKDLDRVSPGWPRGSSHRPEQRVFAHGQHQPSGQAGSRATAQGDAVVVDDYLEPRCPSGSPYSRAVRQRFRKDPSWTMAVPAPEDLDAQVAMRPCDGRSSRRRS